MKTTTKTRSLGPTKTQLVLALPGILAKSFWGALRGEYSLLP